ncbi:hypothetical protein NDU88_001304 [Pleurodeles waltl]|uniref:Uncharacterized protein n=1 Tax=Pleurodeles waltl TaxID=8319 RepID=A0AAV7TH77_PLEWA|nr:hypothetical protein NDU88_001304 [Pleurodeles waltl]
MAACCRGKACALAHVSPGRVGSAAVLAQPRGGGCRVCSGVRGSSEDGIGLPTPHRSEGYGRERRSRLGPTRTAHRGTRRAGKMAQWLELKNFGCTLQGTAGIHRGSPPFIFPVST